MAGDHAAWLQQMAQVLGVSGSGGSTATLTKDPPAKGAAPLGKGSNAAGPADDDDDPAPSGNGSAGGSGAGAPAAGGSGAPKGGGGGGGGGPAGGGAGKPTADPAQGGGTGGGAGGGAPPAGGATGSPAATGAPTAGSPAPTGGGTADPAPSGAKPSTNFATAEEAALIAQQMLSDINRYMEKAQPLADETKVYSDAAPVVKKAVDKAGADAEAAEKGMPPAPKLSPPQGKDPQAQYESAITITGDTRKVGQDADAKAAAIREQQGVAEENNRTIEHANKVAAANAEKISRLVDVIPGHASIIEDAANGAKLLADESKKKADQAAKDKAADADELGKAAKNDAQFAAQAKDAATKAQSAVERLNKLAADVDTQRTNLKKVAADSKAALEAREKQVSGLDAKLKPYADAGDAAEKQEADCKSKLSEQDADAVLKKKYDELGGDDELSKALAAEDKAFETASEKYRVKAKDWYKDTTRKLDDYKPTVEGSVKRCEQTVPKAEEWLKREEPLAEQVKKAAEALGNKVDTPPGKELMYEISQQTDVITKIKTGHDEDKAELEKAKAVKTQLETRYSAVSAQNEANEKYVKDRRTEVNNLLQMENMTLEQKVDYLQRKPKPVRDRIQKQMEADIERIVRLSLSDTYDEDAVFTPAPDTSLPAAIDWKPINEKIAKYQAMSVDDMKKDDPALVDIQQEYTKAGGDQALLDRRMDEWKAKESQDEINQKLMGDKYLKRSEQMRGDYDKANKEAEETRRISTQQQDFKAAIEERFAVLQKKIDPKLLPQLTGLNDKEQAEYQLLEKQIQRLKTNKENLVGMTVMGDFGKNTSSALIEKDRQLYEQMQSRHKKPLPKPTSEDIQKMPLRAKYTELTGKTAP